MERLSRYAKCRRVLPFLAVHDTIVRVAGVLIFRTFFLFCSLALATIVTKGERALARLSLGLFPFWYDILQTIAKEVGMGLLDTSALLESMCEEMEPDEDIITSLRTNESVDIPIELTDLDIWSNYTNDDLYHMDSKIREFLKKTRYARQAHGGYRTTASVVFTWVFGRPPTPTDGYAFRLIHEILKYYCTSFNGPTTYKGKKVSRVYRFSKYAVTNKRPYSLRLRMEEAVANGTKNSAMFKRGPGHDRDKRIYGRQQDRGDGVSPSV